MTAGDPLFPPLDYSWNVLNTCYYGNVYMSTENTYLYNRDFDSPIAMPDFVQAKQEWDCNWCGGANKIEQHLSCSHCGAPRHALV